MTNKVEMADLELVLSWLGMSQYIDRFVQAGFDSWETLQWITEGDLELLNVELGHRRRLQKEIANSKRTGQHVAFPLPVEPVTPSQQGSGDLSSPDTEDPGPKKRSYRHHPKPDAHAPERPYSAYVMFSNHTRDQLKAQNLSFADLSKQVGERWKSISPQEKEAWKRRGAGPWEEYKSKLAEYQKTEQYQAYQEYLAEFKAAQAARAPTGLARPMLAYQGPVRTDPPGHQRAEGPTSASKQRKSISSSGSKITVKRLKKDDKIEVDGETSTQIPRTCENCRTRQGLCGGERPACRQCKENNVECRYKQRGGNARRDVEGLRQKVQAYEALLLKFMTKVDEDDQRAIQDALLFEPQLESSGKSDDSSNSVSDCDSSDDEGGGERKASRVGSMGETDRVNEHNFTRQSESMNFAGQGSDAKWLQRLQSELGRGSGQEKSDVTKYSSIPLSVDPPPAAREFRANMEDMDMAVVGNQIYPLELPVKGTADKLIEVYFITVHLSFPIFNEVDFLAQFEEVYNTPDLTTYHDRTFIALLQLVFAIGAFHAHLIDAEWAGDDRDHTLYVASARMLAVDSGILNDACFLGQTRVFALGALYLLATDQINRSWNLAGLAIRSAQSMGLHLLNITPSLTVAEKDQNARIWFAIISLESMLAVVTGRPSMVRERDGSVSLLQVLVDEDKSSEGSPSDYSQQTSALDLGQETSVLRRTSSKGHGDQISPIVPSIYFKHYVELCIFAKEVMAELYSPSTRHKKWADIQEIISNFDERLFLWKDALSPPFDDGAASADPQIEACRVALRILFYSTRALIHRPCLCRLDEAIVDQSQHSKRTNRTLANKCVDSARAVLNHIIMKPDLVILTRGTTWWMILYHFKRCHIVLLLELSFRAEHMPSNADDILTEAKDSLKWLRRMGSSNPAAKGTWVVLSRLLRQAAKRVSGDVADNIVASEDPMSEQQYDMDLGSDYSAGQDPDGVAYDPYSFSPPDLYSGYLLAEWDEFGFLRAQGGTGSFFPQEDQEMGGGSGS